MDLGCGTGGHATPLTQRRYQVTGVDISPDMFGIASHKADNLFEKDLTRQTKETKQTRETCIARPLCEVNYRLLQIAGDRVVNSSDETHRMHYFFPMEIEPVLFYNEMKLENLTAFPDLEKPADETTWNVLGIGRAV